MAINREQAKEKIVLELFKQLSPIEKKNLLEEHYQYSPAIDEVEPGEYKATDIKALTTIEKYGKINFEVTDDYHYVLLQEKYDDFKFVSNQYLEKCLRELGHNQQVTGEIEEPREVCMCCDYKSIGKYKSPISSNQNCPVCYWKNDFPLTYKYIHSLKKAKLNYKVFGAVNQDSLKYIDPKAKVKYELGSPKELQEIKKIISQYKLTNNIINLVMGLTLLIVISFILFYIFVAFFFTT